MSKNTKMAAGSSREIVGGINLKEGENGRLEWVKLKAEMYSILSSLVQLLLIFCVSSWRWPFTTSSTSGRSTLKVQPVQVDYARQQSSLSPSLSLPLSHHLVFFERRRKYNVPVWMCVHPELNQYIKDVLVATKTLIRKGEIDKIVLAINNKVRGLRNGVCINPSMC